MRAERHSGNTQACQAETQRVLHPQAQHIKDAHHACDRSGPPSVKSDVGSSCYTQKSELCGTPTHKRAKQKPHGCYTRRAQTKTPIKPATQGTLGSAFLQISWGSTR